MHDSIAIIDFGSQYTQLIARRIRENHVYSELFPWDAAPEIILALEPRGYILSGGPASIYDDGAPQIPDFILESGLPLLGICYGLQAITHQMGGEVAPAALREYGSASFKTRIHNPLLPDGELQVWMSHGDRILNTPPGFEILGESPNSPVAAVGDLSRNYFGLQFHPEVHHTSRGSEILGRFAVDICGAEPSWTPASIISQSAEKIRQQVGAETVLSAVSGGVDSSVAAALVHKAVGNQLVGVFVDTGMLREGETAQVKASLQDNLGMELLMVDAVERFMTALKGITEPEQKRKVIGEQFIRIFEEHARQLGEPPFLVQGTIYPDVVESSAPDRGQAQRIKTHHNVGGLPLKMDFQLLEPLRYLFKDEVRQIGLHLGLPPELVWRQPFPGPGLAVRCLGEITPERLDRLRTADAIFLHELQAGGYFLPAAEGKSAAPVAQAFAVLLPVQSVGVMGDQRSYQEVVALRAVTSTDFMTADWARLPQDLLARTASRIVNEVRGVNRVVYDITTKPPATIEWE